jgi:hypothetical protein
LALATGRSTTRSDDPVVVELGCGVTVYPARVAGERWRAVWYEGGRRRQCESVPEDGLAGRREPVVERLTADAPNLERPGSELVAFHLCPGRLPARAQWSRTHAHTQRRRSPPAPTWPRSGRPWPAGARGPGRADGPHRGLQRAAVRRAGRPHRPPGRPGRPGDHGGPQGRRGRRAPVRRGAQEPQVAADHLPPRDAGRVPAGREARGPHRGAPRRGGGAGHAAYGTAAPAWRAEAR